MDNERQKNHLSRVLTRASETKHQKIVPLISAWAQILNNLEGMSKRNPSAHCRIAELQGRVLVLETDHAAWIQILQLHQTHIVSQLTGRFPELGIKAIRFKFAQKFDASSATTVVEPEPVKETLSEEEERQKAHILDELEALIRKNKN